jgi:DNA-binding MarR family transcriptional regulator
MTMERHTEALGRILELVVVLTVDLDRRLARDGLTRSRVPVLWQLHQRGPCTQRALAEAMRVAPRTMTGLVDGLVATGFVTREPHPTDRRATLVTPTRRGARTVKAMERDQRELAAALFGAMPADRFDGFTAGLDEVLARLRELGLTYQLGKDTPLGRDTG